MGFGNRFKKLFGQSKNGDNEIVQDKEVERLSEESVDDETNSGVMEVIEESVDANEEIIDETANAQNFKYLDDLIHSGDSKIVLNSDIILDDSEISDYEMGIVLDRNIVIEGNGHSIDANGKARIFRLKGKKIIFKNITFKNGYAPYGGAIFIYESTYAIIENNCYFNDNKAVVDGGAIFTQGNAVIQDCYFNNNFADEDGGAITNHGILEVSYSKLIGNECNERGGSIYSRGTLKLFESTFKDNIYKEGNNSIYCLGGFIERHTFFNDKYEGSRIPIEKTKVVTDKNFKYLDNLIKSGIKEIILDSDICLNDDEIQEYATGIVIGESDIVIDGNGFSIDAKEQAQIFLITGHNVVLKNISFKNAYSFSYGGVAIQNFGKTIIESSNFFNNNSELQMGGAILNVENAYMELRDCKFNNNQAKEFGAIANFSKLKIDDCLFENNISAENGGALLNTDELEIINSDFINNTTSQIGGAILNEGDIRIYDSKFDNNFTNGAGGAICNQNGTLFVSNSSFENNFSCDGGAIFNLDILIVENSKFINNASRDDGGAILNYEIGKAKINGCKFENNDSYDDGSCIYNKNEFVITGSVFEGNNVDNDIIFNKSELKLFGLTFTQNNANSLIMNDNGSNLIVDAGKASDNSNNISSIFNCGEFFLNGFAWDDNHSNSQFAENIYNEGKFHLSNVKILKENADKTILNKGFLEVKELTNDLKKSICNKGELKVIYDEKINTHFNFNYLDDLIHSNKENSIELDENIFILDTETYFYEGGIELVDDNLVIDGNGKFIDGCGKTRIFNVVGKNIVLKNIIFKNGKSLNNSPYGGGAINIVKGASLKLINCKFTNNYSAGDGGAILNNGVLMLIKNDFECNESENRGGAIFNNGTLSVEENTFLENKSKMGLSIYNNNSLNIAHIDFDNEIFNNSSITASANIVENMTNIGFINREKVEIEDFTNLFNEINNSNEITLKRDFVFNYVNDKNLIKGFEITKNLIINGNNHVIDGNGSASLFNILNDVKVVFKDVFFKNCYSSTGPIIENNALLIFENCKFINNHPRFDESLILNNNELNIINSTFSNNYVRNGSVLLNNKKVEVKDSLFVGNYTESNASILNNFDNANIKESTFENNFSNKFGGVILNSKSGKLHVESNRFIKNVSKEYGGAIFNYGDSTIFESQFLDNSSKAGGAIYNSLNSEISGNVHDFIQNLLIDGCDFKNNVAKGDGGAILNLGVLDLQVSYFIENTANHGGAIYMGSDGMAYMGNCSFKKNNAVDGGAIYKPSLNRGDGYYPADNIRFRNCSAEDNVPNDTNF